MPYDPKAIDKALRELELEADKLNLARARLHAQSIKCDQDDCWCQQMKTYRAILLERE